MRSFSCIGMVPATYVVAKTIVKAASTQMVLFGTKCQHCGKLHIAPQSQLGMMVVCSSCMREFVCLDETGELPFVKGRDINDFPVTFEKSISRAFFYYGIALPSAMHDIVRTRLSKTLSIGESVNVSVSFNGEDYPAELRWFVNQRGASCLHLLWTRNSGIRERLAEVYKEEYRYYVVNSGASPQPWKVTVSLSDREDVFVLDGQRFSANEKRAHKQKMRAPSDKSRLTIDEILS